MTNGPAAILISSHLPRWLLIRRLAAIVIAVKFRRQSEAAIERAGRGVAGLDLEAGALGAGIPRPVCERRNEPAGETLPPARRVGDHRLIAKQPAMHRPVSERRRL